MVRPITVFIFNTAEGIRDFDKRKKPHLSLLMGVNE